MLGPTELKRRCQVVRRSAFFPLLMFGIIPCVLAQAPAAPVSSGAGGAVTTGAETDLTTYTVPSGTKILLSLKSFWVKAPGAAASAHLIETFVTFAMALTLYARGIDLLLRLSECQDRWPDCPSSL